MGSSQGKFDEDSMKEFEATTSLNRYEIYHAFKQFHQLYHEYRQSTDSECPMPEMVSRDGHINTEVFMPIEMISEKLPALKVNPFRSRICTIFSAGGNGTMSFIEFLDMVSAFSPKNPLQQKSHHAFQIFDIDDDGIISREDMDSVLDLMTDNAMNDELKNRIIDGIFAEVNKDSSCDGLSTEDFQYAISRSPDFSSTFSFQL